MKRSVFRLLTVSLSIIAIGFFAGSVFAQGKGNGGGRGGGGGDDGGGGEDPPADVGVGYRVFWPKNNVPSGDEVPKTRDFKRWVDLAEKEQLIAVGFYDPVAGLRSGFVYDYNGMIDPDQTDTFYDVTEIAGPIPNDLPFENAQSIVYSFNKTGRFAGIFLNADNTEETVPFYFDLNDATVEFKKVPIPPYAEGGGRMGLHLQVNELGDILIAYKNGIVEPTPCEAFIYNPDSNEGAGGDIHLVDSGGSPWQFSSTRLGFNSQRVVVGERFSGGIVRFPVGGSGHDDFEGEFVRKLNEYSEFVCRTPIETQIRKNKTRVELHAAKIGVSVLWSAPVVSYPHDLNNSGDVLMEYTNSEGGDYHLFHEGESSTDEDDKLLNIRSMLIEGDYSPPAFEDPMFGLGMSKLTDRDSTRGDFPWIEGTTATGTNPDGSNYNSWFILIPEILP